MTFQKLAALVFLVVSEILTCPKQWSLEKYGVSKKAIDGKQNTHQACSYVKNNEG